MRKHIYCLSSMILSAAAILSTTQKSFAQVGVGTTTPHTSAQMDIQSNSKGLLIPRLTQGAIDSITTPATGLMVYQTNGTPGFYYYNGSAWTMIGASGATITKNATLNGTGTSISPLGINLGNSNTWTANQTFAGTFLITSNSRIAMTNSDNVARDIRFQEPSGTGSQYVGFRAPSVSNNGIYVLPSAVGAVGQALTIATSNGIDSASMKWATTGAALQFNGTPATPTTYMINTASTMIFDNAITNVGSQMSGTGSFTASTAGVYSISACASLIPSAYRFMVIRVNGVDVFTGSPSTMGSSSAPGYMTSGPVSVQTQYPLAAGDVVTIVLVTDAIPASQSVEGATRLLITKL